VQATRGSADEDSESADEDFQESSESDVAEEFDSDHESSGDEGGSDAEMADPDGDGKKEIKTAASTTERPKKKMRTQKE